MDITSIYRGVTSPLRDVVAQIEQQGWTLDSIKQKNGQYAAKASNPHGEKLERTGVTDATAAANVLLHILRLHSIRTAAQHFAGMWNTNWADQLEPIAEAYSKAPVYDPKAAGAWRALADDSVARAKVLGQQLNIKVVHDPEPYANAAEMSEDIHKNKRFLVSDANSNHPVWSVPENVAFRTVHDVLGHAVSGGDFGWHGENLACAAHFPLLSPAAQQALFTECFASDTLVRTKTGFRPISDIKVGDYVLTGDGTFQKVLETFKRPHEGEILELETTSTLGPIRVTAEHPFLAVVGDHPRQTKKLACSRTNCHKYPEIHSFEWAEAGSLDVGSYVKTATYTDTRWDKLWISVPEDSKARWAARKGPQDFEVTDEFLWVVGIYLAEGSAAHGQLSFGLHKDEEMYVTRLREWFEGQGYKTRLRHMDGNGVEFSVNSTTLCNWWTDWLGKGCQNKRIPADLLNLPSERLRPLIEGIMDGDGHYKNNILSQTSPELALQVAEICLRLGGQPGLLIRHKLGKKTVYELTEASADHKIERRRGRRGYWELSDGNAVKVTKLERIPYSGDVYDLKVEGDETFVVQNLVVHNCIGQTAYAAHYRNFGPQKVCFLNDFLQPAQQQNNPPGHSGVHPSQSVAPTSMPSVAPSPEPEGVKPEEYVAPHMEGLGLTPVMSKYATTIQDPNHGWSSGFAPQPGQDAASEMKITKPDGTVTDPLDSAEVMNNASLIDTKWHTFTKEDGSPDYDKMKLAIVNAFRVVLLSPRKDLRWNAVHYQDISNIPAHETDPKVYWDALEKARQDHNVKHFGEDARYSHMAHYKYLPQFKAIYAAGHSGLSHDELNKQVDELLWEWFEQEQKWILNQDEEKAPDKQMSGDEVERKANAAMLNRMKAYVADSKPGLFDFPTSHTAADQMGFDIDVPQEKVEQPGRYGAFMGTHLKAIAQISQHSEEILQAALEDVHDHDAAGHHFRAAVLQLGVPGVGPKVCSFAWLLLQPMTSQLGTIDTHMMDVLGHNYEKDMNNRDYFKFERELAAGRDAAGYNHIPLGAFQWGMWDYKRTGPGSHQDHSAMSVIDPKPHDSIDWEEKADNLKGEAWAKQGPWWWKNTQDARDQAAQQFDATTAQVPQNQVPFQVEARLKSATIPGPRPWINHEGKLYLGEPNQPYAAFLRRHINVPAHELFDQTGYSMGRYDPQTNDILTVEGTPPSIEELQALA